jgi:hypothetical protein
MGIPRITEVTPRELSASIARHCCSHCGAYLFDREIQTGDQVIATDNIANNDGCYIIPKGRVLRITAFIDLPVATTGFLFAGLLAIGAFPPEGFAAEWDLVKLFDVNRAPECGNL